MKFLVLLFLLISVSFSFSQNDTLTIVSYNLLNFPDGRNDCGASNINPINRTDTLRKILGYLKPAIFVACEIQTKAGADSVLTRSLNVFGTSHYQMAPFQASIGGGGALNNALYYNADKLMFLRQTPIQTSSRDINHYTLYVIDPNLGIHRDTVFIDICMAHLKAGNTTADQITRAQQTQTFRTNIDARPSMHNYIICGDMNVYSASEQCYQNLITGGSRPFFDPIASPGNWNNNGSFAAIHTQSPRTSGSYACGSNGGLDDRFDQILLTENVLTGSDHLKFIPSSYQAVGNDGQHFNSNILAAPFTTQYPDSVKRALFYQSDHLPVTLKLEVNLPIANGLGLTYSTNGPLCAGSTDGMANVTPLYGTAPFSYEWDANTGNQTTAAATNLNAGSYCVVVSDANNLQDTVCFEIASQPSLSASAFPVAVNSGCDGQATVLVNGGQGSYSFLWNDPLNQTTQTATNLCAGTYTCVINDSGNCPLEIEVVILGQASLLEKIKVSNEIKIVPNPIANQLNLVNDCDQNISFKSILVSNSLGKELIHLPNGILERKATYTIDSSFLPKGIYFIEVHTLEGILVLKVLK